VTASVLVEPAFRSVPLFEWTLGPEVADLCEMAGFAPDEEQRLALDIIFAESAPGRSAAFEIAVVCSRQNLKTALKRMAAVGWLFVTKQRLVVWSAHEFATSAEAFRDITELIEGCAWLDAQVRNVYRGHGDESIELVGGRRLIFRTRTKGGARGLSGDKVVLDEAMFLQPQHMGALLPTLSARPDPQVLYGGSAGLAESAVWRGVRDRGRAGGDPRLGYLEWCDDLPGDCGTPSCSHLLGSPDCRLDDEARWARANPAMGRRITVDYIAAERRALPPEEFARERLGWWDDPDEDLDDLLTAWAGCADLASAPHGDLVYAIDVSPNSRSAAIVAAIRRDDGLPHVEVVDHHAGTDWVAQRCAELDRHGPMEWLVDPAGPAGALLPELVEAGLVLRQMKARELGQACESMVTAIRDQALRHVDNGLLSAAIAGAGRRDVGDGLWVWSRRRSGVDICPLVAATSALWALSELAPDDVGVWIV
jgi:hypothetical protein